MFNYEIPLIEQIRLLFFFPRLWPLSKQETLASNAVVLLLRGSWLQFIFIYFSTHYSSLDRKLNPFSNELPFRLSHSSIPSLVLNLACYNTSSRVSLRYLNTNCSLATTCPYGIYAIPRGFLWKHARLPIRCAPCILSFLACCSYVTLMF